MLGAIGHDLRTPLASLRLRAEAVEDQAERERMIATIEEMAGTLEDILELARLGRSGEQAVRTDLAALVDALVQDLQDLGQAVEFADGDRLLASVRPALVRRAIRNLIENAIKYGSRADVRLYRAGDVAVLEIDDEGPGIPDGDIERVMDGFVRLDESRNRATGGSGLGLTIARSIIQEHGGALTLQNRADRGLRAIVKLPLQP
jgi:signal transduction histidine kinase